MVLYRAGVWDCGLQERIWEPIWGGAASCPGRPKHINRVGSIDLKDTYFKVTKTPPRRTKGVPRRFLPGNTAFKTMSMAPLLEKEGMTKIPLEERERLFRGVTGSDKYTSGPLTNVTGVPPAQPAQPVAAQKKKEEEDDDEEAEEDSADDEEDHMPDANGRVAAF